MIPNITSWIADGVYAESAMRATAAPIAAEYQLPTCRGVPHSPEGVQPVGGPFGVSVCKRASVRDR
eukprot:1180811-Prorocentrum_minimum.AAC.1